MIPTLQIGAMGRGGGTPRDVPKANVKLLLHFDGGNGSTVIVDNSDDPITFACFGNASISTAQSVFGGASVYFDGTGDWLQIGSTPTKLKLGTSPFTIEGRVRLDALGSFRQLIQIGEIGANGSFAVAIDDSNRLAFYNGGGSSNHLGSNVTFSAGAWHAWRVTSDGTTIRGFIDGTLLNGPSTTSPNIQTLETENSFIGAPSFLMSGFIEELRICNLCLSTASYTVMTEPFADSVTNIVQDEYFSNVSLLLHFDSAPTSTTFVDSSGYGHTMTANGNAQIASSPSKWGHSVALDGTGDYVSVTDAAFTFGTGDFFIEGWFYFQGSGLTNLFTFAGQNWNVYRAASDGTIRFWDGSADRITSTRTLDASTWTYVALGRTSGSVKLIVNDNVAGPYSAATNLSSAALLIGYYPSSSYYFNGKIDEFRVTKGVYRTASESAIPSAPFPN